jgi:F-type H+-transporting ATPase subunit epsilon
VSGTLTLEIATPERPLLKEQVTMATIPGANGALGILPEHAPLLSELGSGVLSYTPAGSQTKYMSVSGGYLEVLPDHVRVLAVSAEFADNIDMKRAEEALKRAEERLAHPVPDLDVARAINAMRRAQARLEASRHAAGQK